MGSYTDADLVPFAAYIDQGNFSYDHTFFSLATVMGHITEELAEYADDAGKLPDMNFNGWQQDESLEDADVPCRDGKLYAQAWTKDGKVIYAINTSAQVAGGYQELYVFSKDRHDLETFLQDVYPETKFIIEADAILTQTA